MAKHYPDRFDRGEDWSEDPHIPEGLKLCGYCEHCNSPDQPVYIRIARKGEIDIERGGQCTCRDSVCVDFGHDKELLEAATFVSFKRRACQNFEPTAEALAAAADAAEYARDPYAYYGVNERDFC